MKRLLCVLGIGTGAIFVGCAEDPSGPTTGSISLRLLSPPASTSDGSLAQAPAEPVNHLQSLRVTVDGPTQKAQTFQCTTSSCEGTVEALAPGSYSVIVEGLVGTEVDHFGQTSGVTVTAGATAQATINFLPFQPVLADFATDTTEVLRFTVSFSAVAAATSYVLQVATAPDFSGATSQTLTGTSTEVTVPAEGQYFVRVRAVNSVVTAAGRTSAPKSIVATQGVATVTVTPGSPTIAAGATQQFSAAAVDGDGNPVSNVTFFWSSSDQSVAIVNQSGLATAKGLGQATITAVGKGQPGSTAITVTFGAAAKLAFKVAPADAEPFGPINPVEVAVQDGLGNETNAAVDVTIAIDNNPSGGALTGTLTVTSVNGVATFSDLSIDSTGEGYSLEATATNLAAASAELDVMLDLVEVIPGDIFTCALAASRNAWCWGWNGQAELGIGTTGGIRTKPAKVVGGHKFSAISAGFVHACAIRASDSTAFCWGQQSDGRMGNGSAAGPDIPTPTAVSGGHKFISISAANNHTCAVRADSLAMCWGRQANGRLGNGTDVAGSVTTPTLVQGGIKFAAVSAGEFHTCGIRGSDGAGFCWGMQNNGRLGNNSAVVASVTAPTAVLGGHTFFEIHAGQSHTCAVRRPAGDRRGMCWGFNDVGQLGVAVGDLTERLVPTFVANGHRYVNISASVFSSCGATITGDAFCWGSSSFGRLGNGDASGTNYTVPDLVVGGHKFSFVRASTPGDNARGHACGRASDGVYCWGRNDVTGQLGDGTQFASAIPLRVIGTR